MTEQFIIWHAPLDVSRWKHVLVANVRVNSISVDIGLNVLAIVPIPTTLAPTDPNRVIDEMIGSRLKIYT